MGARIYYYPDPSGSLEIIDFSDVPPSRMDVSYPRIVRGGVTMGGGLRRTSAGGTAQIRLQWDPFCDEPLARQLQTLQSHLDRGGLCGFSLDAAKTWAAVANTSPQRGDGTVKHSANLFGSWESAGTVGPGAYITIESQPPENYRETQALSTFGGGSLTMDGSVVYTYNEGPVILRHQHFYPLCFRPEQEVGESIVASTAEINWSASLTLRMDMDAVAAIAEAGDVLPGTAGPSSQPLSGLNDLIMRFQLIRKMGGIST